MTAANKAEHNPAVWDELPCKKDNHITSSSEKHLLTGGGREPEAEEAVLSSRSRGVSSSKSIWM